MMERGPDPPEVNDIHRTIEEALGVHIDYKSAEKLESPHQLAEFVQDRVACSEVEQGPCPTASAFYRFRNTLRTLNLNLAKDFRPDANLETLIPANERPLVWKQLNQLGYRLPELHFSAWPAAGLFLGSYIFVVAFGFINAWLWPDAIWMFLFLAALAPPAVLLGSDTILSRFPLAIPRPLNTVRGMVTYLAYRHCEPEWLDRLSTRQVKEVVLLACALEIGMPIEKL